MIAWHRQSLRFVVTTAVGLGALLVSCTGVDDTIGGGLIPGGDNQMELLVDTLGGGDASAIGTYQTYADSLDARNQTFAYLGKSTDARFGVTTAASVVMFRPTTERADTTENGFGYRTGIDSVMVLLAMTHVEGDADVVQKFNVYRLVDSLSHATDSAYYQSYPYEEHIDGEPLFSFDYSGMPAATDELRMTVHSAGEAFCEELLSDTTLYHYTAEDARRFQERFKGLVIAPAGESPTGAAIYANALSGSGLRLYFHRHKEGDPSTPSPDKAIAVTYFFNDGSAYSPRNVSVISLRHDFTGTPLAGVVDGGEVEVTDISYVKGPAGVTTLLRFPDAFFDEVEALKGGDDRYALFVNQAKLFLWVEENTTEAYDGYFQKLGSYLDYNSFIPISDYVISTSDDSEAEVPYGGGLNRSHEAGYYELDITSFLQNAITDPESRSFTLAPTYYPYQPFAARETAIIARDGERPIKVRLTYTLVE